MSLPSLFRRSGQDPMRALSRLQHDFERLFDQLEIQPQFEGMDFTPSCELSEEGNNFLVKFDMPGVKKEDIKVEIEGNQLRVSAERREEKKTGDSKRHYSEVSYGSYSRSFALPGPVDDKKVDAKFENGVLTLTVPKSVSAAAKQISVQ